ncbi:MAG: P-II family nitrogen regulator [Magnetococcus sp. WYHC-3]
MLMIQTILKPQSLEPVREALNELGLAGLTITEVRGYGQQQGHSEIYRGAEYRTDSQPRVSVELAVPEALSEQAMAAIRKAANSGRVGDGKIFVRPLVRASRIRTGEEGERAL